MNALRYLIWRNTKLFFKDRGMFFTALVTPLILLLLFVTFLGDIYRDSFRSAIPAGLIVPESLVEGFAGGWLFSSLLAVCCVTVAFCANMLMVQDKATGTRADLCITPVKKSTLALGYYTATALSTLVICGAALGACFLYLGGMGWYLSAADVLLTCLDVFLLVMFGTALSSVVNHFLSTQGQISAVGTIVSACYGFLCGAYMPISQFSDLSPSCPVPMARPFCTAISCAACSASWRVRIFHRRQWRVFGTLSTVTCISLATRWSRQ